jgi:flagella basal body P-ring formation protein FlgA
MRIATAFGLPWQPDENTEIRIRRDANLIDGDTLRAVIRDHLASQEPDGIYKITFNGAIPEIIAASDAPAIQLADFSMQEAGGTFTALMKVPGPDGKYQTITLRGAAERMVRLPVLKTSLKNGQVITPENVTWTTVKSTSLRNDYVTSIDDMVGATPRRSLAAGEIVRGDALEMPRMVSRGDMVTMIFRQGGMYLTAKGRALDDGAIGQTIKVSNTGSNRTIEARVTATKEVTVN